ncbi:MAG: hypothetical protein OXI87_19465 [Albidovulum sp.]|nr:hypothetical protein [Albidovulum sp.]
MLNAIERRTRPGMARLAAMAVLSLAGAAAALADEGAAERWWNALSPEQMVAALHGEQATEAQAMAAKRMYADLDGETRDLVDAATAEIYGEGGFSSVGAWWESLDCRLMRIAAGDGAAADPASPFCAHYPGSGAEKIMDEASIDWVDAVGQALLNRNDPGRYPE